jgi:hypothetical protein
MDQSKKTMRHFYCRDVLWETFEQMANDFDCSIDYLINEAMRYYARSKNYQSAMVGQGGGGMTAPPPMGQPGGGGQSLGAYGPGATNPPPNGPGRRTAASPAGAPPPPPAQAPSAMPRRASGPSMPPAGAGPIAGPAGAAGTLYLVFNSQKFPINKDQFIIGRGSKTSDLPIKDGNISRKHAAVIRRNGTFYIKDLGSTNGIDYKGMRIDNKRIDEGDVFHLCDYELRFTYRPE